ncbi:uncharacterized protein G2W53_017473 [Senna tora]|uniref:Uncharacterized protein n=1 Tax=Senna tora TaxID=362788 RepID=A0A834WQV7_9FABA|nr:uncharacterized protein G2W53_017473 [Senna tora]
MEEKVGGIGDGGEGTIKGNEN